MKIRTGFVSNSSSSSFVLVTTLEYWEQVKTTLHPYVVVVAAAIMSGPKQALGQTLVSFSTWTNQGTSWTDGLDIEHDGEIPKDPKYGGDIEVWDAWDMVLKALRQDPDKIFEHRIEMG